MPKPSNYREVTPPETQFTQFEARSDDDETLWNAECILQERRGQYLVRWEGIDPDTGEPWADSWVAKHDCTDDLIKEWKEEKRAKTDRAKAKRAKGKKSNQVSKDNRGNS
jgi:hypothetical protein